MHFHEVLCNKTHPVVKLALANFVVQVVGNVALYGITWNKLVVVT